MQTNLNRRTTVRTFDTQRGDTLIDCIEGIIYCLLELIGELQKQRIVTKLNQLPAIVTVSCLDA